MSEHVDLESRELAQGSIGLMEGLCTTRAIRRYTDEPVPEHVLRDILFAATRGPSGSNRQPFRFMTLIDSERARQAKRVIAEGAQAIWAYKRDNDRYDEGSGADASSPKARMARTMQAYVDDFAHVPVLILPCLVRYRAQRDMEGASIYPAVQNLLLAARALGYGGVMTGFHGNVEPPLRELLQIPDDVVISCTVTLGKPRGRHGSVRRRPMGERVFGDCWGEAPAWAVDPPGTRFTKAGPPADVPDPLAHAEKATET